MAAYLEAENLGSPGAGEIFATVDEFVLPAGKMIGTPSSFPVTLDWGAKFNVRVSALLLFPNASGDLTWREAFQPRKLSPTGFYLAFVVILIGMASGSDTRSSFSSILSKTGAAELLLSSLNRSDLT